MSAHAQGQRIMPLADIANLPLANDINVVYGSTATRLAAPAGARLLTLCANKGNWSVALGDRSATGSNNMPAAYNPSAAVSDGTGAFPIKEGDRLTMPAALVVTVKGYAATDALVHYWL